jgi:hypothetical protein
LVVSYFDVKIGPKVLIKDKDIGIRIPDSQIANLMEFHTDGDTFSHCYVQHDKVISLNHCFSIENSFVRGGRYDLMVSVLFKKQSDVPKKEYLYNIFDNIELLEKWIEKVSNQIQREKRLKSLLRSHKGISPYKNREIKSSLIRCLNRNVLSKRKIKPTVIELNQ